MTEKDRKRQKKTEKDRKFCPNRYFLSFSVRIVIVTENNDSNRIFCLFLSFSVFFCHPSFEKKFSEKYFFTQNVFAKFRENPKGKSPLKDCEFVFAKFRETPREKVPWKDCEFVFAKFRENSKGKKFFFRKLFLSGFFVTEFDRK